MGTTADRQLDWDGCCNVRDLGGLAVAGGGEIRWGAVVRADALDRLTAAGWSALWAHGVRTVVDLRNDDERGSDVAPRPPDLTTMALPLDGIEDRAFWDYWAGGPQYGTPLYYRPFLDRFPQRTAGVIAAIAHAEPGGVAVHCGIGRDRTGLVSVLLFALAGVGAEDIAIDYELSAGRLAPLLARLGQEVEAAEVEAFLTREGTSTRELITSMLDSLDVEAYLRSAGLSDDDLAAVRARLVA